MSFNPQRPKTDEENFQNRAIAPVGISSMASAAWNLSAPDRLLNSVARSFAVSDLNDRGEKVDSKVLNERFEGLEAKEPMTELAAEFIMEEKREKQGHQDVLNRGADEFGGTVVPFLAGAASTLFDPADFAIGIALNSAGRGLLKTSKFANATRVQKFGLDIVENLVANAAPEAFVYKANNDMLQEYTATQALTNVVGGTLVMTGLFHAGGAGLSKLTKMGSKNMDTLGKFAQMAADSDKDLTKIIDMVNNDNIKDLKLTEEFSDAVNTAFDIETSGKLLDGADDVVDVFQRMTKAVEEGDLDLDTVKMFNDKLDEVGFDPRLKTLVDPDTRTEMSPDGIANLKETMDSPESDFGFDKEAQEWLDNPETFSEKNNLDINDEFDEGLNTVKALDEDGKLDADQKAELKEVETSIKKTEALEAFTKCLGIE